MIDIPRIIRAITGQPEPLQNPLKDFDTYADLEAWFELHDELQLPVPNLCDDYSREARALAEMDGYFLSNCLVYKGTVYGTPVFDDESVYHVANLAIVLKGNSGFPECWYVDLNCNKLIKICNFFHGGDY